jgi:hypothetical protein
MRTSKRVKHRTATAIIEIRIFYTRQIDVCETPTNHFFFFLFRIGFSITVATTRVHTPRRVSVHDETHSNWYERLTRKHIITNHRKYEQCNFRRLLLDEWYTNYVFIYFSFADSLRDCKHQ